MKFWIIYAFYFLLLSAVPCADEVIPVESAKSEVSQMHDHEDHHHQSEDFCSPLCACTCCGVLLMKNKISRFTFQEMFFLDIEKKYSNLYFKYIFVSLSKIWQPPKLG